MTQRPTAFYPTAPRAEWFMSAATNVRSLAAWADKGAPVSKVNPVGIPASVPPGSFVKMTKDAYLQYLEAHKEWMDAIWAVDDALHSEALRRRAVETFREKAVLSDVGSIKKTVRLPGYTTDAGVQAEVSVKIEKKSEHKPMVSTSPHQADLRSAKKVLRDAKVQRQVNAVKARTKVVESDSAPVIEKRMTAIHNIKVAAPLHKLEEAAAKSAAVRSKQIRIGSVDLATNIDPDSWQVVTRKKGGKLVRSAIMTEATSNGRNEQYLDVDPSMHQPGRTFTAAVRKPQNTLSH